LGKRKRDGNHSLSKNNLIQDLEENEENRCPFPDSNKTKITDIKEPNDCPQEQPQRRNPESNH
jgi:hypothetical protein